MTLFEMMTQELDRQSRKHDLGEGYTEAYINKLTPYELLSHISIVLEYNGYDFKDKSK